MVAADATSADTSPERQPFSPGPFTGHAFELGWQIVRDAQGNTIAHVFAQPGVGLESYQETIRLAERNAALFAQAPRMLEAIRLFSRTPLPGSNSPDARFHAIVQAADLADEILASLGEAR